MKENLVSLAKLLATDDAFTLAFSSQCTDEEKYELAKTKFTDLAREDFSEFLKNLREAEENNLANLSPDELEMVAGGAGSWSTKLAAATMLVTTLGAAGALSHQVDASKTNPTIDISPETSTPQQTRRGGRSFASGVSIRAHAGPSRRGAAASSLSLRRLARRGGLELFQTQGHQPVGVTPSDQPTQPGMHPFIQNQAPARDLSFIKLGSPRSDVVSYDFDHGEKTAQKIFEKHHNLNLAVGSSSLIGELAQIVESLLWERRNLPVAERGAPVRFGDVTFKFGWNSDIVAAQCGSYSFIIDNMVDAGFATRDEAEKILKNLSKPCRRPKDSQHSNGFNLQDVDSNFITELFNDLFEDLGDESKKFVAVLLCESIRFNDDGAFARWSIREIIGGCNNKALGESRLEYERMYTATKTDEGDNSAIASFAPPGGKGITINFILDAPERKVKGSFDEAEKKLEHTKEKMEKHKQYVSPPISPRKDGASLDEDNPTMMDTQEENLLNKPSAIFAPAHHEEEEQEEKMSEDSEDIGISCIPAVSQPECTTN